MARTPLTTLALALSGSILTGSLIFRVYFSNSTSSWTDPPTMSEMGVFIFASMLRASWVAESEMSFLSTPGRSIVTNSSLSPTSTLNSGLTDLFSRSKSQFTQVEYASSKISSTSLSISSKRSDSSSSHIVISLSVHAGRGLGHSLQVLLCPGHELPHSQSHFVCLYD